MIPEEAFEAAYAAADTIPQSIIRQAVKASAPYLIARTLEDAADVVDLLPFETGAAGQFTQDLCVKQIRLRAKRARGAA